MSTILRRCSVAFALLLVWGALPALAQYQTPVIDGTVSAGEYAQTSGDWSMTWDATYLYVAKTNVTTGNGLALYFDLDPRPTPAAGTNANGNLTGHTDPWSPSVTPFAPNLPFRADARSLTGASTADLRTRDGSGAWTNITTNSNDVMTVVAGTTQEVRLRWAAMLGSLSGPPASFNWLGFEIWSNGGMTEAVSVMPAGNPGNGNTFMPYSLNVASTGNGTSSNVFATLQSTWKVTVNSDSGNGSLRDAITNAEADSTSSRRFIVFGTDVTTISVATDLPVITRTTTIDGTSHPNWTADPIVVLASGGAMSGLEFAAASNCVLRGLHINNTFSLRAVRIDGGSGNTIAGNWLGLPANGSGGSNGNNLVLETTSNATIGGTDAADRNIISGAASHGIAIFGSSATQILGNYIGTDATGLTAAGNGTGIAIDDASSGTVIGSAAAGNVIAASANSGIDTESPVTILGNKIGVGADGSTALGNDDDGITFNASNMTIGTIAAPNVIAHNDAGIGGSTGGGLSIRGNSMFANDNAGINLSGTVEPTPSATAPRIDENGLTITFSTTSALSTQSLRLDLYDADPSNFSIPQPATYRASSQCYAGNSFTDVAWNVGAGYLPGDQLVLMATSYADANCTAVNTGTSEPTAVLIASAVTSTSLVTAPATYAGLNENVTLTATVSSAASGFTGSVVFRSNGVPIAGCEAVTLSSNQAQCNSSFPTFGTILLTAAFQPLSAHVASESAPVPLTIARVFNGPGNFSTASLWTSSTPPVGSEPFVIKGACTFDSASPVRAYGSMTLAANASVSWTTNHTVALNVTSITGTAPSAVDMTNGGVLRFSGAFNDTDVSFTRGTGIVILSGNSQPLPALSFNNLTVIGSVDTVIGAGTATIYGTLDVILSASLTGSTVEMRGSLVNNGAFNPGNLIVPTGVTFSPASSFGVSNTMTVNGTLAPSASVVITGGVLTGTGTVKVTGTNATNSFASQYAFSSRTLANLTVEFSGAAAQSLDGLTYGNLTVNNPAGVTLAGIFTNVNGVLTLTAGVVTAPLESNPSIEVHNNSPSAVVATGGRLSTRVGLSRAVPAGTGTYTFPVGVPAGGAPVSITLHAISSATYIRVAGNTLSDLSGVTDSGIDSSRDANIIWRVDANIGSAETYSITANFAGLTDAGATPSTFVLRRALGGVSGWSALTATPGPTSITAANLPRGFTTVGYFVTGNQRHNHYGISAASPQTAGTPFTVTVAAQDALGQTVTELNGTVVTLSSNQGNAEFDSDGNGTYGDNTKTLTNGAFTITTRDFTPELLHITANDTNGKTGSASITVNPASGAPGALTATASSTTQITLSWSAVGGATSYEIWRSSLNSAYTLITTTASTAHNDTGLTTGRTYLYKIRAAGATTFSPTDVATTVLFTDPTSLSAVTVKAAHFTELQTAVNAMRAAAGLTPTTFSSITAGNTALRSHLTALRLALDPARTALGLPALSYTDPTITQQVTPIKAVHVTQLRAGVQ